MTIENVSSTTTAGQEAQFNQRARRSAALKRSARTSRRAAIEEFFRTHLRIEFRSAVLHQRFGSAFRTRVSEINRDPHASIRISNRPAVGRGVDGRPSEGSIYWGELRDTASPTNNESDFMRRRREERARALPLFAGDAA